MIRRAAVAGCPGFDILPYDREKAYDLIDQLRTIAQSHKASIAQIALAWLLAKPYVSTILIGASKVTQLDDNLGASDVLLSAGEMELLDKATAPVTNYPNWFHQRTVDATVSSALKVGLPTTSNAKP